MLDNPTTDPEEQGDPDSAPELPIQTIPDDHEDGDDSVHGKEQS